MTFHHWSETQPSGIKVETCWKSTLIRDDVYNAYIPEIKVNSFKWEQKDIGSSWINWLPFS